MSVFRDILTKHNFRSSRISFKRIENFKTIETICNVKVGKTHLQSKQSKTLTHWSESLSHYRLCLSERYHKNIGQVKIAIKF